jgi:5-oxopent-3-ene-1,2,5-tricarboxylate decarboxylase / 2-hydroxyhepta-2,4-diene-1,7-dioate isomerase
MKLAHVSLRGESRLALVQPEGLLDLTVILAHSRPGRPTVRTPLPLLQEGLCTPAFLQDTLAWLEAHGGPAAFRLPDEARLLAPLPRPPKIVCVGRNYMAHAVESGYRIPDEPVIFGKATSSVIGPEDPIVYHRGLTRVDPEAELAVVIGRTARYVPANEAMAHVAGYTIFNDVTARALQRQDIERKEPWFRSKGLDTFGPMGPYLALPDEVPAPHALRVECRVNGEVRQSDTTASLMFPIPRLIEFISAHMTLEPGDVIATGTPEGMKPIEPGDIVECEVEGLGVLRNPVVADTRDA